MTRLLDIDCFFVYLSFLVPPPPVQLIGPNQNIREGDSVNLTCIIKSAFPKPQVFWYKNETRLVDQQSTNLILTEVTDKDEGSYKCEARNAGGVAYDIINVSIDGKYKPMTICLWRITGSRDQRQLIIVMLENSEDIAHTERRHCHLLRRCRLYRHTARVRMPVRRSLSKPTRRVTGTTQLTFMMELLIITIKVNPQ